MSTTNISDAEARKNSRTLSIVFMTVLIDMLGVGILIPVIPLLLTDPAYAYHLPVTVSQGYVILGFLVAIFPFMQFIATPILGQLSDKIGRKKVLAFSLGGTSLSYVIFALGIILKNIPLLFVARAFDGITGGNISVAQAAIADVTKPKDRAKNFGLIGAAFGVGFIVGPFLGGELSNPKLVSWFDATTPFWFAAILSLINMFLVIFLFDETLTEKIRDKIYFAQSFVNIKAALLSKRLRSLFTTSFLFTAGFTFFTSFFGVLLISRFGYDQGDIGLFFAYVGICSVLTQGILTGYVAKRASHVATLTWAFFGLSLTLLGMAVVPYAWLLYIITVPNSICVGLIMSNLVALISQNGESNEQGKILGINSSIQALAQAIPPVISGYLAASFSPSAPIITASVIAFVAALVFVSFARPVHKGKMNHI